MSVKRRLKVVKLPKAKIADDTQFIETLVWTLGKARAGKIRGYAMVYVVEKDDGGLSTIEAATVFDGLDRHHVLGAIERMKDNYKRREWPDDA